jgi:hypothetical protein
MHGLHDACTHTGGTELGLIGYVVDQQDHEGSEARMGESLEA